MSAPQIQPAPIRTALQGLPSQEWVRWFDSIRAVTQNTANALATIKGNPPSTTDLSAIEAELETIEAEIQTLQAEIAALRSGGGGGPDIDGPTVTLETNGVNNAVQTLLNLTAGANITLSNSGGAVTITASVPTLPTLVRETPAGTQNGTNTAFTLSFTPNPAASLTLYLNGVEQIPGLDYTVSGTSVTYTVAPKAPDYQVASYTH